MANIQQELKDLLDTKKDMENLTELFYFAETSDMDFVEDLLSVFVQKLLIRFPNILERYKQSGSRIDDLKTFLQERRDKK